MLELPKEEIRYFSKSRLKAKCLKRYKLDRKSSIAAMCGEALHLAISLFLVNNNINNQEISQICNGCGLPEIFDEQVITAFEQWKYNIGLYVMKFKEIICVESSDAKDFRYGKKITKVKINDQYGLQGMFDLVCIDKKTGNIEVIDWKTGMIPKEAELENMVNALLAKLHYKLEVVGASIYSVAMNTFSNFVLGPKNVDACMSYVDKRIREILAEDENDLTAVPNEYCFYCGLKDECPEYLKLLDGVPLFAETGDLPKMLDEIDRLKAIRKACENEIDSLDSRCKEMIGTEGGVKVGDHVYYVDELPRYDYPTEAVCNAISDLGLDPSMVINVTSTSLNRLLSKVRADNGDDAYKALKDVVSSLKQEKSKSTTLKKKIAL